MSRCFNPVRLIHTHLVLAHVIKTPQCMTLKWLHKDKLCYMHKLGPMGDKSGAACVFVHVKEVEGLGYASPTNPMCVVFDVWVVVCRGVMGEKID